jgi:hypothetical protein
MRALAMVFISLTPYTGADTPTPLTKELELLLLSAKLTPLRVGGLLSPIGVFVDSSAADVGVLAQDSPMVTVPEKEAAGSLSETH